MFKKVLVTLKNRFGGRIKENSSYILLYFLFPGSGTFLNYASGHICGVSAIVFVVQILHMDQINQDKKKCMKCYCSKLSSIIMGQNGSKPPHTSPNTRQTFRGTKALMFFLANFNQRYKLIKQS